MTLVDMARTIAHAEISAFRQRTGLAEASLPEWPGTVYRRVLDGTRFSGKAPMAPSPGTRAGAGRIDERGSHEESHNDALTAGVGGGSGRGDGSGVGEQPSGAFCRGLTGDTLVCESTTYTVTSGSLRTVIHEGAAASGNENVTGTLTLQNVVAEDPEGNVYSLRGAFWFGGSFNAQQGAGVFTDTGKLQVISTGSGTVDSVNVTSHVTEVNGHVTDFDFGTCEEPE